MDTSDNNSVHIVPVYFHQIGDKLNDLRRLFPADPACKPFAVRPNPFHMKLIQRNPNCHLARVVTPELDLCSCDVYTGTLSAGRV